ncbi:unnamed protein product, partial [Ectocarpus sp. 12 AP-2014]
RRRKKAVFFAPLSLNSFFLQKQKAPLPGRSYKKRNRINLSEPLSVNNLRTEIIGTAWSSAASCETSASGVCGRIPPVVKLQKNLPMPPNYQGCTLREIVHVTYRNYGKSAIDVTLRGITATSRGRKRPIPGGSVC